MPAALPEARFQHGLPATARGLPGIRSSFRSWLSGFVPDELTRGDLVLAVSELCRTAIRLLGGASARHIAALDVRAWVDGAAVVIEIHDTDSGALEASVHGADSEENSRGLAIVATIADVLTVRSAGNEILLRARRECVLDSGEPDLASVG